MTEGVEVLEIREGKGRSGNMENDDKNRDNTENKKTVKDSEVIWNLLIMFILSPKIPDSSVDFT